MSAEKFNIEGIIEKERERERDPLPPLASPAPSPKKMSLRSGRRSRRRRAKFLGGKSEGTNISGIGVLCSWALFEGAT